MTDNLKTKLMTVGEIKAFVNKIKNMDRVKWNRARTLFLDENFPEQYRWNWANGVIYDVTFNRLKKEDSFTI